MSTEKPPTAFIAAGLVLLVMPLLVGLVIAAFGLTAGLPESDPFNRALLIGFFVWLLVVVAIVAVFATRLLRRTSKT